MLASRGIKLNFRAIIVLVKRACRCPVLGDLRGWL